MKTIGILGGMSPEASINYYRRLIDLSRERWRYRCPRIIIFSLDLEEWKDAVERPEGHRGAVSLLCDGVARLHRAGAEFAVMASNTPHMFFEEVAAASPIPILSIVEETAREAECRGFHRVGLLGTTMVMEGEFYRGPFTRRGISVVVPESGERARVHETIVKHLVCGDFRDEIKSELAGVAHRLHREQEIEALVLGCTELPLVLNENDLGIPVLNTTEIHVRAAFARALEGL